MTGALDPPTVTGLVLLGIAVILLVARLVGALAVRIGQPRIVGEIVGGILLGPTVLGPAVLRWDSPWPFLRCEAALVGTDLVPSVTSCLFPPQSLAVLGVIGQLALMFYMFLVGLEVDWRSLSGRGRAIATTAVGSVAAPTVGAFMVTPLFFDERFVAGFGTPQQPSRLAFSLMLGAMLSVTAFPVMARILQDEGQSRTPVGSVGIAAASIATVLMFLLVAVASHVADGRDLLDIGLRVAGALAYIVAMLVVVRPSLRWLGDRYEDRAAELRDTAAPGGWTQREAGVGGPLTTEMFAGIIAVLLLSSFVAHALGLSVIVGAFLAGLVLPARQGLIRDMTAELFDVVVVILLPVFLAFSGLQTDLTGLNASHLLPIGVLLGAAIATKWLGAAVGARIGGLTWRDGSSLGILMNCRGLLVLVVALIALDRSVITGPLQIGAVVMALVTTGMTGPMFRWSTRQQGTTRESPSAPEASS